MRDFKRVVRGIVLEDNTQIELTANTDHGAVFLYQNKIRAFLNNVVKESLTITRGTTAELQTHVAQSRIENGEMVFNTTENTFQQVINGQLVSLGSGGSTVDPGLEGRVETLESQVTQINSDINQIESQLSTIADNQEEMDDNLAIARAELYDLINLTGVPENADNLGEFSGLYLDDNLSIKEALQALEVAVELGLGSSAAGDLTSLNAQIAALENDLTLETQNRISGDSATLASAQQYTTDQIALIPPTDLTQVNSEISTIQSDVLNLQNTDTNLQTQINTINNTTIPTAITDSVAASNLYTDGKILDLTSNSPTPSTEDVLFFENFENTVKGTLLNGASIIDSSTNPLEVLNGSKSLRISHVSSTQEFRSNNISVPLYKRLSSSNTFLQVQLKSITDIPPLSPQYAVVRVFDVSNNTYLLDTTFNTEFPISGGNYVSSNGFVFNTQAAFAYSNTTELIRIEIISKVVSTGAVTIVDDIKVS